MLLWLFRMSNSLSDSRHPLKLACRLPASGAHVSNGNCSEALGVALADWRQAPVSQPALVPFP